MIYYSTNLPIWSDAERDFIGGSEKEKSAKLVKVFLAWCKKNNLQFFAKVFIYLKLFPA